MSVFGGDSWAREAQYRKRRVDDLIIDGVEASVYKKLYNGKFACLVCPNNPVLDTATMLSVRIYSIAINIVFFVFLFMKIFLIASKFCEE